MSSYQQEQLDALEMVLEQLQSLSETDQRELTDLIAEYLVFRKNVDSFLSAHLSDVCTLKCYENRMSACCSKEGIITFFADVVINSPNNMGRIQAIEKAFYMAGPAGAV
jgi:hypothetical protein